MFRLIAICKSFDLLLYPNSVFTISLKTNRLYIHKIIPSTLFVNSIPIHIGYVIRYSKIKAIWKDNKTWLIKNEGDEGDGDNSTLIKLEKPDENKINMLKDIYYEENMISKKNIYPDLNFSLNNGDYLKSDF